MSTIFGIPTVGIMNVLLVALALCLLSVAWVAWRRPVIFKLGVRNIPRRQAQTTLIVVGLMLSTLIITAALGTGDTLDYSLKADVYTNLGQIDELVVASRDVDAANVDGSAKIDASAAARVETALKGNDHVDGILPILEERVPVLDQTSRQAESEIVLAGLDPGGVGRFGGLTATNGKPIDLGAMQPDGIVLSAKAAEALDAKVGDALTVYYHNTPHVRHVAAIAKNSYLSGVRRERGSGLEVAGMVMPLAGLQTLTGQAGTLSAVAISNQGGVRDSIGGTAAVQAALRPALTGTGLGIDPVKQTAVADGQRIAGTFTGLFLVLGLFSVAAGILLIVLIFTMLAAERRSEMGMARAVGAQRRQLIQQFVAEGAGYAVLAGLVGAALGIGAAVGIADAMKLLFGQYVPITPHVTLRSLVVAYCLGVVITFLTVVVSSWKVSRLNVVAAVRNIPDVAVARRTKRTLVWSALLLVGGGLLAVVGHSGHQAVPFFAGLSLAPVGLTLLLRFFRVPTRPVVSILGLWIMTLWLLPTDVSDRLFGALDRGISLFFVAGLFMVIGATVVIVQNTDLLLAGVSKLGGLFRSKLPAVRTAVAFPGAARGRTGMTIAMFSLIIFSLVMLATMSHNFDALFSGRDATAGWDVRADAPSANALTDFPAALTAAGVDPSAFTAVGVTTNPNQVASEMRLAGTEPWKTWAVRGMDGGFLAHSTLKFQQRATGYATDADVVTALKTEPNVAVIDAFAVPQGGNVGGNANRFQLTGLSTGDKTFAPIEVELADPRGGTHPVTIIGIIDSKVGSLQGLYANQQTIAAAYPATTTTSYHVALKDPAQADPVAKAIEAELLEHGVQSTSIRDELKELQKESTGFLYLVEGFMALGLVVGVAAIGVIAFRSVVERRQQIGVLRAIGYQRGMVSLSFLIETTFVVGLGILAGTTLGIVLARNLFADPSVGAAGAPFSVPVLLIATVLAATMAVSLLMTWLPSRQASRIAPAEALRYE